MSAHQPRAAIYTCISKDKVGDEHGVHNQLAECERYAATRGWKVVARLEENDLSAFNGVHRPQYEEALRLVDARDVDVVLYWRIDRFVRRVVDLESVITRFEQAGCKLAAVSDDLDLSTGPGRMVGRMLSVIAQGEVEAKGERQRLAAEEAARNGKRHTGCPRPFGYADDHVTPHPVEGPAVAEACRAIAGGSTVASIARGWDALGLQPPQGAAKWSRVSVTTILRNPRIAGLSVLPRRDDPDDDYRADGRKRPRKLPAEIVDRRGNWQALVSEETWRACLAVLADPARRPSQGVRTLLGGIATCRCGNKVIGSTSHRGTKIYRCDPESRDGREGPHATRAAAVVDEYVRMAVLGRLARPDIADIVAAPHADVAGLRAKAQDIRRNLDELAGDRALGLIDRAQMVAATSRGQKRLAELAAQIAEAGRESVLTPLVAAANAAVAFDDLDLPRQRAVVDLLLRITLLPAGRGTRRFNPASVVLNWQLGA
jgi:DNA invertase Pin-like site-specific DNA recombinase